MDFIEFRSKILAFNDVYTVYCLGLVFTSSYVFIFNNTQWQTHLKKKYIK